MGSGRPGDERCFPLGPQVDGVKESSPQWAFGSAVRFGKPSKSELDDPAPGKYDADTGIGIQVNSKKTSLPRYGFGSSTRDHQEKLYVDEEHTKGLYGKNSPGPSTYTLNPAVGNQVLSYGPTGYARSIKNGSQPTWVMGKAKRFGNETGTGWVPGPGSYAISAAVDKQVEST